MSVPSRTTRSPIELATTVRSAASGLLLLAVTTALAALLWRLHADPLSAEERQLIGTWRRYGADGSHIRDERYNVDRSYEVRYKDSYFVRQKRKRWSLSDGEISFAMPVPISIRVLTWSGGKPLSLGGFSFPSPEAQRAWGVSDLPFGLWAHSEVKFVSPNPVFGESIRVTSDEFPGATHTLRRIVSNTETVIQMTTPIR